MSIGTSSGEHFDTELDRRTQNFIRYSMPMGLATFAYASTAADPEDRDIQNQYYKKVPQTPLPLQPPLPNPQYPVNDGTTMELSAQSKQAVPSEDQPSGPSIDLSVVKPIMETLKGLAKAADVATYGPEYRKALDLFREQVRKISPENYDKLGALINSQEFNDATLFVPTGLGMFTGRMSKDALSIAKGLEAQGTSARDIRVLTGLEKNAAGEWRQEISDANAKFIKAPSKPLIQPHNKERGLKKVSGIAEVIDHPEFFKLYPEAKGINVYTVDMKKYSPGEGTTNAIFVRPNKGNPEGAIVLSKDVLNNKENATSAILHELQHWVQNKEGAFPLVYESLPPVFRKKVRQEMLNLEPESLGLIMESVLKGENKHAKSLVDKLFNRAEERVYRRFTTEVEARNTERRRLMSAQERRRKTAESTEDIPRAQHIIEAPGDTLENELDAMFQMERIGARQLKVKDVTDDLMPPDPGELSAWDVGAHKTLEDIRLREGKNLPRPVVNKIRDLLPDEETYFTTEPSARDLKRQNFRFHLEDRYVNSPESRRRAEIKNPEEFGASRGTQSTEADDYDLFIQEMESGKTTRKHFSIIDDQTGQHIGDVGVTYNHQTKDLYVEGIGASSDQPLATGMKGGATEFNKKGWTVGPSALMELIPEIRKWWPEAKTISGERVSGARGKFGREIVTRPIPGATWTKEEIDSALTDIQDYFLELLDGAVDPFEFREAVEQRGWKFKRGSLDDLLDGEKNSVTVVDPLGKTHNIAK